MEKYKENYIRKMSGDMFTMIDIVLTYLDEIETETEQEQQYMDIIIEYAEKLETEIKRLWLIADECGDKKNE